MSLISLLFIIWGGVVFLSPLSKLERRDHREASISIIEAYNVLFYFSVGNSSDLTTETLAELDLVSTWVRDYLETPGLVLFEARCMHTGSPHLVTV